MMITITKSFFFFPTDLHIETNASGDMVGARRNFFTIRFSDSVICVDVLSSLSAGYQPFLLAAHSCEIYDSPAAFPLFGFFPH